MDFKNLRHYFIPHPKTHQKAHLLHWHYLIIYILLFVLLRVGFDLVNIYNPGVLGINSDITVAKIIEDTNQERTKAGLSPVIENSALDAAAALKAKNMFEENYWAHYSPSGKNPWEFISGAGYKFSYAGENLARNFSNSDDVVKAWMASPSHRENIMNAKYEEIGIAVVDGTLNGQKTTLVVQMFGRPYNAVAAAPSADVNLGGQKVSVPVASLEIGRQPLVAGTTAQKVLDTVPTIDPFSIIRVVSIAFISFIALLIALDFIILKRRGVFRLSSHHIAHLSFLAIVGAGLVLGKVGEIL